MLTKNNKHLRPTTKSLHFINLNRPLTFAVKCGSKVVIPAGATGVKIAFRQSHLRRLDESTNKWVALNVYLWNGKIFHA